MGRAKRLQQVREKAPGLFRRESAEEGPRVREAVRVVPARLPYRPSPAK